MSYGQHLAHAIYQVLLSIDLLGNALAAGNHKVTISARCYYLDHFADNRWFNWVRQVIDFAFYPFDGKDHCRRAFESQSHLKFYQGSVLALTFLSAVTLITCIIIAILSWLCLGIHTLIKRIR